MTKRKRSEDYLSYFKPLEVTLNSCYGDTTRMIKKFGKKTRKEEVLKHFYGKLMCYETKGQKNRRKKIQGIYETKKREKNR